MSFIVKFRWLKVLKPMLWVGLLLFLLFFWLNLIFPLRAKIDYSKVITDRKGNIAHIFLNRSQKWRLKVELHEISEELKNIIVFKEDRFFFYHFGVNPLAIVRAGFKNLFSGKVASGASTITMQVARLLEPKPRTFQAKLIESFRALQLEWYYSKAEILQMYLNLVPYGSNIEGVKSASFLLMGIEPQQLSLSQVVALAIVPNRPTSLALGKNNSKIETERNQWLLRLKDAGVISDWQAKQAQFEPLEAYRRAAPQKMPHLSNLLHKQFPQKERLTTTIDPTLQSRLENLSYRYMLNQKPFNIHNAAVLVVDNTSGEVLAYIGSTDFADSQHSGQVNGVLAYRSPGSTLKPLIYGIAFDKGIATPATVLLDIPTNFDGYAPENFDMAYRGKITAQDALATSLNVTAVKLLDQIGKDDLIEKLRLCEFGRIERDRSILGLSLALGGCATNLWELTALYAAIAQSGQYQPLHLLEEKPHSAPKKTILSQEAAFMLAKILTTAQRPDIPNASQTALNIPEIAWKTGTSYGRRDAWCLGFNHRYTVGVWVGNFDNTGVQELTGAQVAAPLVFAIFQNLAKEWLPYPQNLQTRRVCKESGLPPGQFCLNTVEDWYIPAVSSQQTCNHLKEFFTDEAEKISFCRHCLPALGYKRVLYPNLDPALKNFYLSHNTEVKLPPAHNPVCQRMGRSSPPKIVSPLPNRKYKLLNEQSQIGLACQTDPDVHHVYWYANDKFLAKSKSDKTFFFSPAKGKVKISCTDESGKNTDIEIVVE